MNTDSGSDEIPEVYELWAAIALLKAEIAELRRRLLRVTGEDQ